jgi:Helix-turn-helix domain
MAGMDIETPVSPYVHADPPALLKPQDVAALLAVSPRTVRRLASEGVLDRVRIGHRISRYTRRSVVALTDPETSEASAANRGFTERLVDDTDQAPVPTA